MNHNPRITLAMNSVSAAVALSEGNPGAATAIAALLGNPMGMIDLCHLDDAEIYGADIWIGYKDVCNFDLTMFQKEIQERTLKSKIEVKK